MLVARGVVFIHVPHHIFFMSSSPPRPRRNRFHKMIFRKITPQNSFTFEKKSGSLTEGPKTTSIGYTYRWRVVITTFDSAVRSQEPSQPAKLRRCFFSLIEGKLRSLCHLPWPKRRPDFFSKRKTSFGWLISRFFSGNFPSKSF